MNEPIPVFSAERAAGLEPLIRSRSSVAYAAAARLVDRQPVPERALAILRPNTAKASLSDADLAFLQSVMVSTGWNKNDDVFEPAEVWKARGTPVYKPINYEHVGNDIIGHIVSARPVDDVGGVLAEDSDASKLPSKYHLLTGTVLYRLWEDEKLQKRMETTLAEIGKGEWYVSMECRFGGFDYATVAPDGTQKVVARNDTTSFLTKHLRVYGGTGEYDGQRIGRVLRNILFTGKGLVRTPANPDSVIVLPAVDEVVRTKFERAVASFFGCGESSVPILSTKGSSAPRPDEVVADQDDVVPTREVYPVPEVDDQRVARLTGDLSAFFGLPQNDN